jgi:hypothetical protein
MRVFEYKRDEVTGGFKEGYVIGDSWFLLLARY